MDAARFDRAKVASHRRGVTDQNLASRAEVADATGHTGGIAKVYISSVVVQIQRARNITRRTRLNFIGIDTDRVARAHNEEPRIVDAARFDRAKIGSHRSGVTDQNLAFRAEVCSDPKNARTERAEEHSISIELETLGIAPGKEPPGGARLVPVHDLDASRGAQIGMPYRQVRLRRHTIRTYFEIPVCHQGTGGDRCRVGVADGCVLDRAAVDRQCRIGGKVLDCCDP